MAFLGAVVGCSAASDEPKATPGLPSFAATNGSWILVRGTGQDGEIPILDEAPISMVLTDGVVSGVAACNQYEGGYRVTPRGIVFAGASQNLMGCSEAVETSEEAYTSSVFRSRELAIVDDQLRISGPDVELVFDPFE